MDHLPTVHKQHMHQTETQVVVSDPTDNTELVRGPVSHLKRSSPTLLSLLLWRSSWNESRLVIKASTVEKGWHTQRRRGTERQRYLSCVFQPLVQVGVLASVVSQQVGASDDRGRALWAGHMHLWQPQEQRSMFTVIYWPKQVISLILVSSM